jgi:hypothetical protein
MKSTYSFFTLVLVCLALTGCISPKSFMDPSVAKVSYEQIEKPSEPMRLILIVEFQRNGVHVPKADPTLKDNTERILRGTGVIVPVENQEIGEIKVTVNNTGDLGSAAAKGLGTGLTFGLVGSTVMDAYEMTVTISTREKTTTKREIKHAMYTAIGNTTLPPEIETVPINVGFERVLEQMLLRAILEMQKDGDLTKRDMSMRLNWQFFEWENCFLSTANIFEGVLEQDKNS